MTLTLPHRIIPDLEIQQNFEAIEEAGGVPGPEGKEGKPGPAAFETAVAMAYRSTEQTINSGVFTRVVVNKAIKDPGSNLNLTEGWYVAPAEGYYFVSGQVEIELDKGFTTASIFVNGTEQIRGIYTNMTWAETAFAPAVAGIIFCKKGDKIELQCLQESGGVRKLAIAEFVNRLSVMRVGEGPEGKEGKEGKEGPAGVGVPTGGAANEALVWESAGKAKWELIANANIKPAAGIEESKLSIPEMVKLTGEQTITGGKTFETPTPAASEAGTAGTTPIKVRPGKGGEATGTGTRIGGKGATVEWELGGGGTAPNAATKSTGGEGGRFKLAGGAGAAANVAGTGLNVGGKGSLFELLGASGGAAQGITTGKNEGGAGSSWTFKAGTGGPASNSTTANKGGAGGNFTFEAGEGNNGTGEGTLTGGAGGSLLFQTGPGGTGTTTPGKGGPVRFELGKEGGSETVYGTFEIKQRGNLALFLISGEGLTTIKKGLTVEGALTLPVESIVEAAIKAEAITAGKIATNAVEEAKIKDLSVTETKLGPEAVVNAKVKKESLEPNRLKPSELTTAQIKAEGIEAASIKKEAIETAKIKLLAITEGLLAEESVSGKKIKTGTPEAVKELKANTKVKGIAGSSTIVYLSVLLKAELTEGEVIADGKTVYKLLPETLATSSKVLYFSFKLKAGAEFELKLAKGALESTTSVYVLQEG